MEFDLDSVPNPNLIYDLFGGIFKPQFIRIALLLDVFTPLAKGASKVEQVAGTCHSDAAGVKALLDYLCALQVLECRSDQYALTPTAETFLVRGRKAYVGDMILDYTDVAMYDIYKSWLDEIGFQAVDQLSERWLAARK
jgi:hypothetical protein